MGWEDRRGANESRTKTQAGGAQGSSSSRLAWGGPRRRRCLLRLSDANTDARQDNLQCLLHRISLGGCLTIPLMRLSLAFALGELLA